MAYRIEWKKGDTIRYYVEGTGVSIQFGQYRNLDSFDKYMKQKPTWHGKWYVDVIHYEKYTKTFSSRQQARVYFKNIVKKIAEEKQLR